MASPFLPRFLVTTLASFLLLPFPLLAASKTAKVPRPHPIELRMGISPLGTSLGYYLEGKDVNHYRDLKSIMGPSGDPRCLKLVLEAEDADRWSWGFFGVGLAVGITTALVLDPTPVLGVDLLDRAATGGFWAQFPMMAGAIFRFDAEGRKFNAVQRYNAWARGESTQMSVAPALLGKNGALGLRVVWGI